MPIDPTGAAYNPYQVGFGQQAGMPTAIEPVATPSALPTTLNLDTSNYGGVVAPGAATVGNVAAPVTVSGGVTGTTGVGLGTAINAGIGAVTGAGPGGSGAQADQSLSQLNDFQNQTFMRQVQLAEIQEKGKQNDAFTETWKSLTNSIQGNR